MEVYAFGFRNQAGVAFGPEGQQVRERAGGLRQRRQRSRQPPRRQRRREALHRHREGPGRRLPGQGRLQLRHQQALRLGAPTTAPRSTGPTRTSTSARSRSSRPRWPYRFQPHLEGVRGVPLIAANPNPDGYINPILEWDTNNPIDGIAWSAQGLRRRQQPVRRGLRHPRHRARRASSRPGRRCCGSSSWSRPASSGRTSPATSRWARTPTRSPRTGAAWSGRTTSSSANDGRTMYVVDYGEVYTDFTMPSPFYTVPKSGVIWTITRKG